MTNTTKKTDEWFEKKKLESKPRPVCSSCGRKVALNNGLCIRCTHQPDQTSDWREPKFTDYKSYQSGDEEVIELNETSFDDLVQSIISSKEQRHQREMEIAYKEGYRDATTIVLEPNHAYKRGRRDVLQEVMERLPKKKHTCRHDDQSPTCCPARVFDEGFNDCLDQISQSIKKLAK